MRDEQLKWTESEDGFWTAKCGSLLGLEVAEHMDGGWTAEVYVPLPDRCSGSLQIPSLVGTMFVDAETARRCAEALVANFLEFHLAELGGGDNVKAQAVAIDAFLATINELRGDVAELKKDGET
jgi:hypothetical protein